MWALSLNDIECMASLNASNVFAANFGHLCELSCTPLVPVYNTQIFLKTDDSHASRILCATILTQKNPQTHFA